MTPSETAIVAAACVVAVAIAFSVSRLVVPRAPERLVRTNVHGRPVPAVLGLPLLAATVASVTGIAVAFAAFSTVVLEESIPVAWAFVMMFAAGFWDDLRGDERPRGFKGHLGALRGRAVTGGVVKIGAGVVAGAVAAGFLPDQGASPAAHVVEVVALTGLTANLVNLFDRAPGRAGKVTLLAAIPLLVVGDAGWSVAAMPVFAAAAGVLVLDLREQAMLGDAGANPLGAVLGVGLAASLSEPGRLVAILVLLALNLASERWSFSRAIERTPLLRWIDGLGRKDQVAPK